MRQLEKSWQTVPKPENEWGKVECEPIVSEAIWNQVNQIIEEHTKNWKRPGPSPVHLFGGLAQCACGNKMYVCAGSPKYVCRKCCNKIPIVDLEAIFHEEMKGFFAQSERIAEHLQQADRNLVEKTALLETHKRAIQAVREEMHQTHQLYLHKQISGDGFRDLYAPAEERLNQIQTELPKIEAEVDFLRVNKLSADDILHEANSLYDQWPKMLVESKRKIAESLVEKIVIGEGEIDITFSYLPSSEELCKNQQGLRLGGGRAKKLTFPPHHSFSFFDALAISTTHFLNSSSPSAGMMMVLRRPSLSSTMRRNLPSAFFLSWKVKDLRSNCICPFLRMSSTGGVHGCASVPAAAVKGCSFAALSISSTRFLNVSSPLAGMMRSLERPPVVSIMRKNRPRGSCSSTKVKLLRSTCTCSVLRVCLASGLAAGGGSLAAWSILSSICLKASSPESGMMRQPKASPVFSVMRKNRPRGFCLSMNTKLVCSISTCPYLRVSS